MSFAKAMNNQDEPTSKHMVGRVDEVIQKVPVALNRINAKNPNGDFELKTGNLENGKIIH